MSRRSWLLVIAIAACARADVAFLAEVPSADGSSHYDPLAFWAPGGPRRVSVRAGVSWTAVGLARDLPVSVRVSWGLLPPGAPRRDASIVWSDPEEVFTSTMSASAGSTRGEVWASVPIARRAREWRDAGLEVVACRVVVEVAGAETDSTLDVLPPPR